MTTKIYDLTIPHGTIQVNDEAKTIMYQSNSAEVPVVQMTYRSDWGMTRVWQFIQGFIESLDKGLLKAC